ncbi:MAG: sigma-70 family RNA polymerase sigma factor [Pseudomonadota bacterium]
MARLTKRTGCVDRAADLTQSTFLKLMSDKTPPMRSPRALLATIARCLMVDEFRRIRLERAWAEAIAVTSETLAPSAEDCVEILDLLVRIDLMLDGLGSRAKRVFLLSRLDGMTYREIAAALNVSLSTVEKDMAAAIRHCRDWHMRSF